MLDISVVIPLYNKAKYIKRALNSILSQTIQSFEIIVVNDGSTDGGADIVRNMKDTRIRLISQKNKGVSAAKNLGIMESSTELISFLDADDEWEPDYIETMLIMRKQFPNAGMYSAGFKLVYERGKEINGHQRFIRKGELFSLLGICDYLQTAVVEGFPLHTISTAVNKNVFSEVGLFKVGENFGEDADMFLRVLLKYSFVYCGKIVAKYHQGCENSLCTIHEFNKKNAAIDTLRIILGDKKIQDKVTISLLEDYLFLLEKNHIKSLIRGNMKKAARKELREVKAGRTRIFKKMGILIYTFIPIGLTRFFLWVKNKFLNFTHRCKAKVKPCSFLRA